MQGFMFYTTFRRFLFAICLLLSLQTVTAQGNRNLLVQSATEEQLAGYLQNNNSWVKYPAYNDRAAWDKYTGSVKDSLITNGEKYLNYQWKTIPATAYLDYERTGTRTTMEAPLNSNLNALSYLLIAELAEGKGRFMDQIINGAWAVCEHSSWTLAAHLVVQKTRRALPNFNEEIIDLVSGDVGALLSWAFYFFKDEWNKTDPVIAAKVKKQITDRIITPYLERDNYWWQAFNAKPGATINNWNVWCNANVLVCMLLVADDSVRNKGVYKTMRSVDKFLNHVKEDGACEEGPSYWGHAAGKLYDYLQVLYEASKGKINIYNYPMVKDMGEYISRSYVGNGWVVNFADASAKGGGDAGLIYRYGKAVNSNEMKSYAAYLSKDVSAGSFILSGRDFYRTIENINTYHAAKQTTAALSTAAYTWYPQTEFCYMRSADFIFAAKGGFNNESHNHNDIGTFSLYYKNIPFIIDVGVGTYTRETFSSRRYSIWTMQSNYHNLPLINGKAQPFGAQYKARQSTFNNKKNKFSLDIAGAYSTDANVKKWNREFTLQSNGLTITDAGELTKADSVTVFHLMCWAKPDIKSNGKIVLHKQNETLLITYEAKKFTATYETIVVTDKRLSNVWGDEVYRLILTAKDKSLKQLYKLQISNK